MEVRRETMSHRRLKLVSASTQVHQPVQETVSYGVQIQDAFRNIEEHLLDKR